MCSIGKLHGMTHCSSNGIILYSEGNDLCPIFQVQYYNLHNNPTFTIIATVLCLTLYTSSVSWVQEVGLFLVDRVRIPVVVSRRVTGGEAVIIGGRSFATAEVWTDGWADEWTASQALICSGCTSQPPLYGRVPRHEGHIFRITVHSHIQLLLMFNNMVDWSQWGTSSFC